MAPGLGIGCSWLQDHGPLSLPAPASPGQEVEEIPEEWNLYYPMQLDLDYGRSAWDDYEFDIHKGKTGMSTTHGRDETSGVEGWHPG